MSDALQVELVSADRLVWSGEAVMVKARTAEGDVGILRNHSPLLSVMVAGVVEIRTDSELVTAAVDTGFLSMSANRVSILTEHAALASEIDVAAAREELEQARAEAESGEDADVDRLRLAEARVRAAERVS